MTCWNSKHSSRLCLSSLPPEPPPPHRTACATLVAALLSSCSHRLRRFTVVKVRSSRESSRGVGRSLFLSVSSPGGGHEPGASLLGSLPFTSAPPHVSTDKPRCRHPTTCYFPFTCNCIGSGPPLGLAVQLFPAKALTLWRLCCPSLASSNGRTAAASSPALHALRLRGARMTWSEPPLEESLLRPRALLSDRGCCSDPPWKRRR